MGQKNSKDELVYQQVLENNVEAIKVLRTQGARLEWIDKQGKTPLIIACMDHALYLVAKTLIELGANVNAYRPGRHAGTPLHHATKRGLDNTVTLLLSNQANPFVLNDDCQSALDLARSKGFNNIVRTIEAQICYFCGELCEVRAAPGILGSLVPQRLSRKRSKKSWVVINPCSLPNSRRPVKLEAAVYPNAQDPQPRALVSLSKCKILEPKFHESDPVMIIFDESTKTRYKFLSAMEGDKQQIAQLYNACKGVPQVMAPPSLANAGIPPPSIEANAEAAQLPVALDTSIQSTVNNPPQVSSTTNYGGWGSPSGHPKASHSGWADEPGVEDYNGWAEPGVQVSSTTNPAVSAVPSAPPLPDDNVLNSAYTVQSEAGSSKTEELCCVICWEAPIEGACVPCGHMAGCMSCLMEIKAKKGLCPVCRTKIDQIIKLYAV